MPSAGAAPVRGLYLLGTHGELSRNHNSSPSFALCRSELERGKKDGLLGKRMVYRSGAALRSDRGPIFAQKRVSSHTLLRCRGPGGTGSLGRAKPTTATRKTGPVKRYLCVGWEVRTRAAKAATSRWQMLHLPAKHPSRTANKNGGR